MLQAILLGQLLSVLISATGIFSTILAQEDVAIPATQSLLNYLCLACIYGAVLIAKGRSPTRPWQQYAALSLLDVSANYCLVWAYQFTSLTSATLLDCFTIPCVLALSWRWLGANFRSGHWLGAAACVAGVAVLVATDGAFAAGGQVAKAPLVGDGLVLVGAALYAVCNVAQEELLGHVESTELLAMFGAFGVGWGSLLAAISERRALAGVQWSAKVVAALLVFNAALFAFSSLVPHALRRGGAAILNLSLLSSDLWAALARLGFFGGFSAEAALSFASAFALVCAGLAVYARAGPTQNGASLTATGGLADTAPRVESGRRRRLEEAGGLLEDGASSPEAAGGGGLPRDSDECLDSVELASRQSVEDE